MTSRAPSVVALVLLVLVLATAAGPVDRDALDADRFDRAWPGAQAWFLGEQDESGTSWSHWRLQVGADPPLRSLSEIDYVRVGQGGARATVTSRRLIVPGLSLDVLHPPGSPVDLVLVGDAYRRPAAPGEPGPRGPLVTTPWIARPAIDESGTWSPCRLSATATWCDLDRALARTRSVLPQLPRWVDDGPDGTRTLHTGIRLADLIAQDTDPLDDRKLAEVVPLLPRLVPLTVVLDDGGRFRSARLSGRLEATGVHLDVDVGIEHHGPAGPADVPRPPTDPAVITPMDEAAYTRFVAAVQQRGSTP